ncbi:ABC transporter ATP-binding protein [Vibrio quintilis]|uniref:Putative multidrug export ATP-binding/permease protein n=1 Tax=Vibrio quintilis TaxID=1117707 RepID=A0A1M7YZZ7_9VIBR|nr:ABC transporter ATP-binding protein [Vibrio quintilis]SHO58143.1 Putative multidrug export ATP-binding/permease protein [Vibrio quintilis]
MNAHTTETEYRSDAESLKRIWALAGPVRRQLIKGILFRFAQSFCLGLGFGAAIMLVTDLCSASFTPTLAWGIKMTLLAAISLIGQVVFSYLASSHSWIASFKLGKELRLSMLNRLRELPLGFHLSRNRGDTVTMLTTDMQMVETFMSDGLPRIAEAFGLPVAVFLFLLFQDWVIAISALASVVVAVPIYIWTSRYMAQLGIKRQDMQASAAAKMIEFVQGLSVIRSFNRLAKGEEDFKEALKAFRQLSINMVVQLTAPLVVFGLVLMLGAPVIIWTGGWRYLQGETELSTMITAIMLIYALYSPLLGVTAVMEQTRMADASLTRMDRILTSEPLPEPSVPVEPDGLDISFHHVSFGYQLQPVLKDISFSVPGGSMTAIVGPSGAGKSTVLNLLPRFWDVDEGCISIGGVDVRELSAERLASMITVVFQDVYLFSGTIFDNISFGKPEATPEDVESAARIAQAHAFISALPDGYQTRVGEGGAALSGGERQRISIARAILKDAPVILLDEATAAIDPTNERALQKALAALTAHKTLIVVAHKLSTVREADQIICLDDGRIVESGNHDALIERNGLYSRLWHHWTAAAEWRLGKSVVKAKNVLNEV